ncbi:MAG: hypothetical protein QXR17_08935 [Candidatus Bathyarchaeia archaeon]
MSTQVRVLDVSQYIDDIALAALQARNEDVEKTQVNKLLEYLEATDSFTVALYIARQVSRNYWGRGGRSLSAARLLKIINDVMSNVQEESKRKEVLRKVLGYFKWFFEVSDSFYYRNKTAFNNLIQKYSQVINNPKQSAPQGFAVNLLTTYL